MNYIKKLQEERAALLDNVNDTNLSLIDLLGYLNSPKFRCGDSLDGYVHVKDVIARVQLAQDQLFKFA